jgi:V8-like Glu-specific endopeptidase
MKTQRVLSRHLSCSLLAIAAVSCGGTMSDDPAANEPSLGENTEAVLCGTGAEQRSQITSIASPYRAVGRLHHKVNGGHCTAAIIGPYKILTASHCVEGNPDVSVLEFQPQYGITTLGVAPVTVNVVRATQGRDVEDNPQPPYPDWAILTVDTNMKTALGANYQELPRVIPPTVSASSPLGVRLLGYDDALPAGTRNSSSNSFSGDVGSRHPARQDCQLNGYNSDGITLSHNCWTGPGSSGGPMLRNNGGTWQLVAVNSGNAPSTDGVHASNGTCAAPNGNVAATGASFSFAPDNAAGLAIAYTSNGRMRVYATDNDWSGILYRELANVGTSNKWTAWNSLDSSVSNARAIAAVNLSDNRQQIFWADTSGNIKTKWENTLGGTWTSTSSFSSPVTVKQVAASGGNGVTSHVFTLGTDNHVRMTYRSSSTWSTWKDLGAINLSGNGIAAVYFSGVHQVFVTEGGPSAQAWTTWGNGSSGFGTISAFGNSSSGYGWGTVGAGILQDGRVNVIASDAVSGTMQRVRGNDGVWSPWQATALGLPGRSSYSINSIAMGHQRPADTVENIVAVGDDGNIFVNAQLAPTFPNSFGVWRRFYK